ncbi:MAG: sigma 54-interacting transcriptional regulator, partial [Planctomycetota bacterium]|nr:sigma 54-interacting transcriptional regulator [Planctomycetota bacterium]
MDGPDPQQPAADRETDLAAVRALFDGALTGPSAPALIAVETADGHYTRPLLDELASLARRAGFEWLEGDFPHPRHSPYEGFADVARQLARRIDLSERRWWPYIDALRHVVPQLTAGERSTPLLPLDPGLEPLRLLDTLSDFFVDAGRELPLVLCLRDLERSGPSSLELLRAVARKLRLERPDSDGETSAPSTPSRLLLVVVYRGLRGGTEREEERKTVRELDELVEQPEAIKLPLRPLSVEQLRRRWAEQTGGRRIPDRLAGKILDWTDGTPRLVDEYLRRLASGEPDRAGEPGGGASDLDDAGGIFSWPRDLDAALMGRFQALPAAERELLEALSTSPSGLIPARVVGPLLEMLGKEQEEERGSPGKLAPGGHEISPVLARLKEQGFLELRSAGEGTRVGWPVESLPRQVAQRVSPARGIAAHRALCDVLLDPGAPVEEDAWEEVAHHAREAGLDDKFREYALRAAERLRRAQCLEEAAEIYESVMHGPPTLDPEAVGGGEDHRLHRELGLKLVEIYRATKLFARARETLTVLLSLEESRAEPEDLAGLYRLMGEVYMDAGERTNARYFLEKSVRLLKSTGDSVLEPGDDGAKRRRESELCQTLFALGQHYIQREKLELATEKLDECLDLLVTSGSGDLLLARVYLSRARIYRRERRPEKELRCLEKALELAQASGSPSTLSEALSELGRVHLGRGDDEAARSHFELGKKLAENTASRFDEAVFEDLLGTADLLSGQLDHATRRYTRSLRLSERLGDLRSVARGHASLGRVLRQRGETDAARERFKRSIDLYARINDQLDMAANMTDLAGVLESEGNFGQALDYAYRALEKYNKLRARSGVASAYLVLSGISEARGDLAEATKYARHSWQIRRDLGDHVGTTGSLLMLADLALKRGAFVDAFQYSQDALAELGSGRPAERLLARGIQAQVFLRVGRVKQAVNVLEDVRREAEESQLERLVGTCSLHLARAALEQGRFQDAGPLVQRARELFRRFGFRRLAVEATLESCRLELELGHIESASSLLEEAYSRLEDLGIRDLVPRYFYLRSCVESSRPDADPEAIRKYLQRGLVEAQDSGIPEFHWRLLYRFGIFERQRGNLQVAEVHFHKAKEILDRIHEALSVHFQEHFYELHERAAVIRAISEAEVAGPVEPEGARPAGRGGRRSPARRPVLHKKLLKIHEIAAALAGELDARQLLEKIIDLVLELFAAERAFLIVRGIGAGTRPEDGEKGAAGRLPEVEKRIEVARNVDREQVSAPERKVSESIADEVLRSGKPFLSGNAAARQSTDAVNTAASQRLRSVLCVPLLFQRRTIGAIYVDNRHRANAFDEDDLRTLEILAKNASIAITNARLIEESLNRTAELRESQRATDAINIKLRNKVHKKTAQLAIAHADLQSRQRLLESHYKFENIVGDSKPIQEIFFLLRRLSTSELPVLIQGESGTGKELIARAVHFNSARRAGSFVSENCGALPENLMESELFGHEKGAFTDAIAEKKGLFELAHNGTLFLDEIGDTSPLMQQKLLRVLEEGEIRRVGSRDRHRVDVRLISASNKELQQLVAEGTFREDLYYRLNGVRIHVPSLRERKEDIPLLVRHFLEEIASRSQSPVRSFTRGALRALVEYDWPGNVRELRNFVERTLLISGLERITEKDIHF